MAINKRRYQKVSAKNLKGKQLKPGGHKYFARKLVPWLRKRKAGVKPGSVKAKPVHKSLGAKALAEARDLLGVLESGGNNRGRQVERIIRANGGTPGEAWCGDTVAYVYRRAGSKSVQRSWAAVRYLGKLVGMRTLASKRAGAPGDIVVYDFESDGNDDHTGLLVSYTTSSGKVTSRRKATHIKAIEGNTTVPRGEGVGYKIRSLDSVSRVVRVTR